MKTAIQELFSKLEIEHPELFNTNTPDGRQFINDYYPFFELEKQQIIKTWYDCKMSIINKNPTTADQYYNETFKI
jgi:hypothetical protein